ncbi:MAG TPA: crossover junction endodeoxyribonuclease RuvC [Myxococcota bacterium]|nr:crossover junction endodeoxyribonuclease RuvC [Myxococcota bacterium]
MRILGIDPGSNATGYGVVFVEGSSLRRLGGGTIRVRGDSLGARLAQLQRELARLIAELAPEVAALESVFSARNARSALVLGHARGVALATCAGAGLATDEYSPSQVKVAVTGFGRAEKPQVAKMVQRLLGLAAPPPSDEADALAIAVCHGLSRRGPARLALERLAQESRA